VTDGFHFRARLRPRNSANGIHPAALEAGLEGMWSPVMKMTIGYCEYE
jgi:hypothetical protein